MVVWVNIFHLCIQDSFGSCSPKPYPPKHDPPPQDFPHALASDCGGATVGEEQKCEVHRIVEGLGVGYSYKPWGLCFGV